MVFNQRDINYKISEEKQRNDLAYSSSLVSLLPSMVWQAVDLMNKYITKYANFLNVKTFKYQMLLGHKNIILISCNSSTQLIKGETLRIKSTYGKSIFRENINDTVITKAVLR